MRKITLITIVILAAVSCTKISNRYNEPYVQEHGRCTFIVKMEDSDFVWDAVKSKIGVYSETGDNVAYSLRSCYNGCRGEVEFFGPATKGIVNAYYPYTKEGYEACREGKIKVPSQQKWYDNFADALQFNMPYMVASNNDGKLLFKQDCGALHISIKIDFPEEVTSITLSGSNILEPITVTEIDRTVSIATPLDIWVILEQGSYDGLILSVVGVKSAVTAIIEGEYEIEACRQVNVEAKEQYHDYGGSDLEAEEVEFD